MSDIVKPKHMHVYFDDPDDFERVKKIKGKREWKEWLLTLPDQFRNLTDQIELWKRRAQEFEKENEDLHKRIASLQEKLGDE